MLEDGIRVKTLSGTPSSFPAGRHPLTRSYATTFPSLPPPDPSSPHIDIYIYIHIYYLCFVSFLFIGCISAFDLLQAQQIGRIPLPDWPRPLSQCFNQSRVVLDSLFFLPFPPIKCSLSSSLDFFQPITHCHGIITPLFKLSIFLLKSSLCLHSSPDSEQSLHFLPILPRRVLTLVTLRILVPLSTCRLSYRCLFPRKYYCVHDYFSPSLSPFTPVNLFVIRQHQEDEV